MEFPDAEVQSQAARLRRLVPKPIIDACEQIAWRIGRRLTMKSEDVDKSLPQEIGREVKQADVLGAIQNPGTLNAAVLFLIAAVLVLIGDKVPKGKEIEGASLRDKLASLMHDAVVVLAGESDRTLIGGATENDLRRGRYYYYALTHKYHQTGDAGSSVSSDRS